MGKINTGRVLIGGLAAGVVANLFDFISNEYLLKADWEVVASLRNLDPAALQASMTTWIIVDFVFGILLVFAYAAMRPRFGPGPKTALVSGFTLFIAVTAILSGFVAMGMFTQAIFLKGTLFSVVTTAAASLAGASLYKE
jgi:hypothetical protein